MFEPLLRRDITAVIQYIAPVIKIMTCKQIQRGINGWEKEELYSYFVIKPNLCWFYLLAKICMCLCGIFCRAYNVGSVYR